MIGLAVISLVLVGAVALVTSASISVGLPWITRRLGALAPQGRTRVIAGLLLSPVVAGVLVLLLSFGPCLGALLAGMPDTCAQHGGPHLLLCLRHGGRPSALGLLLGALITARAAQVLAGVVVATGATSRLARLLRLIGSRDPAGRYFVVPGSASFTAGWPRAEIFVGSELIAAIDPARFAVVIAHERAHQRRRHVAVKLLARGLALFHLPNVSRRLVEELDAALEQSCDIEAAQEVGDPLLVAESLVSVARLHASSPAGALATFADAPDALAHRVSALCNPPWSCSGHRGTVAAWVGLNSALLLALALVFDRQLHDVTEALLQILGT